MGPYFAFLEESKDSGRLSGFGFQSVHMLSGALPIGRCKKPDAVSIPVTPSYLLIQLAVAWSLGNFYLGHISGGNSHIPCAWKFDKLKLADKKGSYILVALKIGAKNNIELK